MTKDEALKLALEAFDSMIGRKPERVEQAITAIKEALAQTQEPVAWEQFHEHMAGPNYVAPQRTWVGLTDDEIWEAYMESPMELDCSTDELYALSRTVEAKLRSKNNV